MRSQFPSLHARDGPQDLRMAQARTCKTCHIEFPASGEHFYSSGSGEGLKTSCKACFRAKVSACSRSKPRISRVRSPEQIEKDRQRSKRAYAENREARSLAGRAYYQANQSAISDQARKWRADNADTLRESKRLYHEANREKILDYLAVWRASNREKIKAGIANRRARERAVPSDISLPKLRLRYEQQGGLCPYCQTPLNHVYEVEHAVPLIRGGDGLMTNILCACKSCNRRKYRRTAEEFCTPEAFVLVQEILLKPTQ